MADNSVLGKEQRIFRRETAELAPSHSIEKADNPTQPQDTRTIRSITKEAEESRSWIYAKIGDKSIGQPAAHMENIMNASKASQTKGQSCKFLTPLPYLFPELPSFSRLGHYGHGLIQPHSLPPDCAFPHGCAPISDSSHPWSSISVDGKTPGGRGRQDEKHLPSSRTARQQLGWAWAGAAALTQSPQVVFPQNWLCLHLLHFIFHCHGYKHCWDFLGSPWGLMSLSSHHNGFLFVCIFLNNFF